MTIQTGHGKRRGARAGLGTGKRGNSSTQRDSKAVPRFAPNFSVYVLPPDVVCLYSEDRKFFLHGALYCALAAAIGAGKSVAQIVRALEKDFPSDQIREALKRLADRRFVVPAPRASAGRADAYWASLGMSPADANANLQNCRVRIEFDRRAGRQGARRRAESAGRSRRAGRRRPDRHAGERLSRGAAGRIEPAALVGPHALAPGPALRHFSPGGAGVQPGQQSDQELRARIRAKASTRAPAGPVSPSA